MSASLMTARFGELPFVRPENRTVLNTGFPDASFDKCRVLEIKTSALFLAIAVSDIKDIKRGRTPSAPAAASGSGWAPAWPIHLRTRDAKDPHTKSNGFDFFQTDSRKSAEFLIFNQSFLFKGESENAERR